MPKIIAALDTRSERALVLSLALVDGSKLLPRKQQQQQCQEWATQQQQQ